MLKIKFFLLRLFVIIWSCFSLIIFVNSIDISTCSNLNSVGSIYYLTADILNSGTSNCINISANNVVLDCQNHLVQGNLAARDGIVISRPSIEITNVTIQNCVVSNWNNSYSNIYLLNSNNNTLSNIVTRFNGGINLYTSSNNTLIDIELNSDYIYFDNSLYNNVSNINCYNYSYFGLYKSNFSKIYNGNFNDCGLDFTESSDLFLDNFNISNFTGNAFYTYHVDRSNFSNFIVFNNSNAGVYIINSDYLKMNNFVVYENNYGIYLDDASDFVVVNNTVVYDNFIGGIEILDSSYGIFQNINISNSDYGFFFSYGSDSNNVSSIILNNNNYGIFFDNAPEKNRFYNLDILNNNYGIFFDGYARNNLFYSNSLSSNILYDIYFRNDTTIIYPRNNSFYNNSFSNASKIFSTYEFNSSTNSNYFNYSGIGNKWDDMANCSSTMDVGGSVICTNPSNYTISSSMNIYDFRPFDYRYVPVQASENSNFNSIFPSNSIDSILISFGIILSYFIFN